MTVAHRPADMASEPFRPAKRWSTSELCRHTRERHSSEVTPAPPQGWTSEQDQSDTYHLSETGLIATLAVVYGLTSSPHVQTARQSRSPPRSPPRPTTARKQRWVALTAYEPGSAHKLRSACRLRDLLRHGGSKKRTRAVELMLCYRLSPRTEQLQSVIVTQKPGRACAAEEPSEEVMQQDSACLPRAPREPPRIHL